MKKILRILSAITSILFFAMFFVPMLGGVTNIGNISGLFLCVWIFCVSVKPVYNKIKDVFSKNSFTKIMLKLINIGFTAFAIYGLVVTSLMIYCASQSPAENATAVVLGAQVRDSGPSVMLWGRINAAEKYLDESKNASAVLSGGQGMDEPMSEAQAMYNVLVEKGIDGSRLYQEEKSTNTTENLKFSMQVIKENNLNDDIAVVTDGFHQLRVRIIANQLGIKGNVGAVNSDTSFLYLPTFAVREWFALPYQLLFR